MSDGKRRRYRKPKQDEKRPIILKREDDRDRPMNSNVQRSEIEVQPRIILRTKSEPRDEEMSDITTTVRTVIVTRSDAAQSPASLGPSPNYMKEQAASDQPTGSTITPTILVEPVPQMTRPATVICSTGYVNVGAKKLFVKTNTDFLVVGVIGTQGVGKSAILNLLANEDLDYDYYSKVFVEEDSMFPTKLKHNKCSSRSRTESTHMFITSDRLILLDSPPVLCNSYKKDMTTNELDDIRNIITFLSVCHLVIVVQDDYFNMSLMRLLQIAELMKPSQDNKTFYDYFPNLMFVKNRAKRVDFAAGQKERMDRMLRNFFKDSQMRVLVGQTVEQQMRLRKGRSMDGERSVNSFLFPEVTGPEATTFHDSLPAIIENFRSLVFMTPRNEMLTGPTELTEEHWFELLTQVAKNTQNFFFKTYEEIHRKHLDGGIGGPGVGGIGDGNSRSVASNKDAHLHENWRD